jgi:hypothetical protein
MQSVFAGLSQAEAKDAPGHGNFNETESPGTETVFSPTPGATREHRQQQDGGAMFAGGQVSSNQQKVARLDCSFKRVCANCQNRTLQHKALYLAGNSLQLLWCWRRHVQHSKVGAFGGGAIIGMLGGLIGLAVPSSVCRC